MTGSVMPKHPLLITLSGPSGVGKDSTLAALRDAGFPAHYAVTATTRPPRAGERDGVDYYFVDDAAFRRMIEGGELLEHAVVYGRYYGVPKAPIAEALRRGDDVLVDVDVQGAATIRALVPQAVTVFLLPDSMADLEARLRGRDTEDEEAFRRRMDTVRAEIDRLPEFDYAVVNTEGRLADTVATIRAIIIAERCRVGRSATVLP